MSSISGGQAKELIEIRKSLGMDDPREGLKECELCDSGDFRPGVMCPVPVSSAEPKPEGASSSFDPAAEEVVKQVTDQIMASLNTNS
jgi:hypothetical protein